MQPDYVPAYISLGSNTANATEMLERYISGLADLSHSHIVDISAVYQTEPQDFKAQPWFANQVVKAKVDSAHWTAAKFLDALLRMENSLGRCRSDNPRLRYGPRCIDADLLLFGETCCVSESCVIPHPRMLKRAFVLVPLSDIDPDLSINSKKIASWLKKIDYHVNGNKIYQKG